MQYLNVPIQNSAVLIAFADSEERIALTPAVVIRLNSDNLTWFTSETLNPAVQFCIFIDDALFSRRILCRLKNLSGVSASKVLYRTALHILCIDSILVWPKNSCTKIVYKFFTQIKTIHYFYFPQCLVNLFTISSNGLFNLSKKYLALTYEK